MKFINTTTNEVYSTIGDVRKAVHPVRLPSILTKEALQDKGLDYLYDFGPPKVSIFQEVKIEGTEVNINGLFQEKYIITDIVLTAEEKTLRVEAALKNAKETQYKTLNYIFENKLKEALGDIADSEMKSWDKQEQEARAFTIDSLSNTPYIDSLLAARGGVETKAELVLKIITKADLYTTLHGTLLGTLHAKTREVFDIVATDVNIMDKLDLINSITF